MLQSNQLLKLSVKGETLQISDDRWLHQCNIWLEAFASLLKMGFFIYSVIECKCKHDVWQCVTWHLSSIFNLNSFERDRPYWNILGYISTYLILMRNLIDKTTRISRRTHWISHLNSHDIHMISVNEWCAVVSKEITAPVRGATLRLWLLLRLAAVVWRGAVRGWDQRINTANSSPPQHHSSDIN